MQVPNEATNELRDLGKELVPEVHKWTEGAFQSFYSENPDMPTVTSDVSCWNCIGTQHIPRLFTLSLVEKLLRLGFFRGSPQLLYFSLVEAKWKSY